jgi:plasmid stabilization system protein ParE
VDGNSYLEISSFEYWSASGVAAVWAEENTREAIYEAFRRRETFATSGPRIRLRLFASPALDESVLERADLVRQAYDHGVSMGGELSAGDTSPLFIGWAVADANGAPLQRLQIIKGWIENGEHREQIYDIACSEGQQPDPATHRCPDNGARVGLSDCSISADVGATELKVGWRDPDYRPGEAAFYYLRALENPSCRWSTWDAIRAGVEPRSDLPRTIQERAWSSPIWLQGQGADRVIPADLDARDS